MLLPRFDYHMPMTLAEACSILETYGDEARVLAGGTDLLVDLKTGSIRAKHLVSLERLELSGVTQEQERIRIGSRSTVADLLSEDVVQRHLQPLMDGARSLGSPQIRNRATIGGNLCSARPAADLIPPLLVLDAEVYLSGPKGDRAMTLDAFILGPGRTALAPGEILEQIVVDLPRAAGGGAYLKLGVRRAMEIARVGVAVFLSLEEDGKTIRIARIALGAVGPRPIRALNAERVLTGSRADARTWEEAARTAVEHAAPRTCHEFKCKAVAVLTRRALEQAWRKAVGNGHA